MRGHSHKPPFNSCPSFAHNRRSAISRADGSHRPQNGRKRVAAKPAFVCESRSPDLLSNGVVKRPRGRRILAKLLRTHGREANSEKFERPIHAAFTGEVARNHRRRRCGRCQLASSSQLWVEGASCTRDSAARLGAWRCHALYASRRSSGMGAFTGARLSQECRGQRRASLVS